MDPDPNPGGPEEKADVPCCRNEQGIKIACTKSETRHSRLCHSLPRAAQGLFAGNQPKVTIGLFLGENKRGTLQFFCTKCGNGRAVERTHRNRPLDSMKTEVLVRLSFLAVNNALRGPARSHLFAV